MPRKKKEFSEEENFEIEKVLGEELEEIVETSESVIEEKEQEIIVPDKHEYKITFFLFENNALVIRKENGQTISRTIPRTKSMKIGDVILL